MDNYERINELKKLKFIYNYDEVTVDDLFLKDENNESFFEFIVKEKISISDNTLIEYISNNVNLLHFAFENNYFLKNYYNVDLLFENISGETLIELAFKKNKFEFMNMPPDILNRLFTNISGKYFIEKIYEQDEFYGQKIIKEITDFDTLYNCFSNINRLDLMQYSNENCLLAKTSKGKTMLEELIDMNVKINLEDKSYRTAEILFQKGKYDFLLQMDGRILLNYPTPSNNYLSLLIEKYQNGEDILFDEMKPKSDDNQSVATICIKLLENNIPFVKPSISELFANFNFGNKKNVIQYMYEINKDLTIRHFDNLELCWRISNYILGKRNDVDSNTLEKMHLQELMSYLYKKESFVTDLLEGKVKEIKEEDIYADDLVKPIVNGITPIEYALKKNIHIYYHETSIEEILIYIKCKKDIYSIKEEQLYEKVDDNNTLLDLLIQNKQFNQIKFALKNDLRIMDYCEKYNNYSFLSDSIIAELLVDHNGSFLIEKYLDNENFISAMSEFNYKSPNVIKLYEKGYKSIILNAKENLLLKEYNGQTILEDLLKSNLTPTFKGYNFTSLKVMDILLKYNRYDLMYNASLNILLNYPSEDNNYLQYLIDNYKKGLKVNFEKMYFIDKNKELTARCFIQMSRNGLYGLLDDIDVNDLIKRDKNNKNLLYYLVTMDKDLTLNKIINYKIKKNPQVYLELKLLGIDPMYLDIHYLRYDYDDLYRKIYNEEYDKGIISPVEDLLEELRTLFEKDGTSNMEIINSLIKLYRYNTSINPIFISELKALIDIKKNNPDFYYSKEMGSGYFSESSGVVIENSTISTIAHETGHAMHFYLTGYEIPENYLDVLRKINQDADWINRVEDYAKEFWSLRQSAYEKARVIVSQKMDGEISEEDKTAIETLLSTKKEEMLQEYLSKGYTKETLDIILNDSFTIDEFLAKKKEIEIEEVCDAIMRNNYDAFISIGDIIDAITDGKMRSNLLNNKQGGVIPHAYGHGVRYYCKNDEKTNTKYKFTEMIANYASIVKSKDSVKILSMLRKIVGDELFFMLDNFYKEKIMILPEYDKKEGKTI